MIQKNKRVMSRGNTKMASINKNVVYILIYINMRKYNMKYDQVIHPIPEYKASKQGTISTNIICKYNRIKRCPMIK